MADDTMTNKTDFNNRSTDEALDLETRQEGELYNPDRTLDSPDTTVPVFPPLDVETGDISESGSGTFATDRNAAGYSLPSAGNGTMDNNASTGNGIDVAAIKDQAEENTQQFVAQTKETAGVAIDKAKETAGVAIDKAKDQVKTQLSQQKDRAVDSLGGAVNALQQAAQPFRDAKVPYVAEYAESFAGQVDNLANYLRDNDIDKLTADVEQFARQNPALFIGGAFVLGLGVARFLKSSGSNLNPLNDADRQHALVSLSQTPQAQVRMSNSTLIVDDPMHSDENLADLTGDRPLSAHGYVPGVGVMDEPTSNI
jgi:uncharacterized protein YjbJ (UPF0337 family)